MRSAAQLLVAGGVDVGQLPEGPAGAARCGVRVAPGWFLSAWQADVAALALPWTVFVRPGALEADPRQVAALIYHELVHVDQWRRYGTVGFLMRYLRDYLAGRARGLTHLEAYLRIRFEAEARRATQLMFPDSA